MRNVVKKRLQISSWRLLRKKRQVHPQRNKLYGVAMSMKWCSYYLIKHQNIIRPCIQLPIEKEMVKYIFLGVFVNWRDHGTIEHNIHRKANHTDDHLHRVPTTIHDKNEELSDLSPIAWYTFLKLNNGTHVIATRLLEEAFKANGDMSSQMKLILHEEESWKLTKKQNSFREVSLPFLKNITDRSSRLLTWHNIKIRFRYRIDICCSCQKIYRLPFLSLVSTELRARVVRFMLENEVSKLDSRNTKAAYFESVAFSFKVSQCCWGLANGLCGQ